MFQDAPQKPSRRLMSRLELTGFPVTATRESTSRCNGSLRPQKRRATRRAESSALYEDHEADASYLGPHDA